jgi:hypothetical protein
MSIRSFKAAKNRSQRAKEEGAYPNYQFHGDSWTPQYSERLLSYAGSARAHNFSIESFSVLGICPLLVHGGGWAPPEAEFLDEIQTKVLRVFLLAIESHLYSFA